MFPGAQHYFLPGLSFQVKWEQFHLGTKEKDGLELIFLCFNQQTKDSGVSPTLLQSTSFLSHLLSLEQAEYGDLKMMEKLGTENLETLPLDVARGSGRKRCPGGTAQKRKT